MLKRIPTDQVRLGMFIQKMEGSWLSHPFWKSKFLLTDPQQLAELKASQVKGVFIDTSKGADVAAATPVVQQAMARGEAVQGGFGRAESRDLPPQPRSFRPLTPRTPPSPQAVAPRSLAQEYGHATALINQSVKAMHKVFDQARLGKAVQVSALEPMIDEISNSISRNPHAFTGIAKIKKDNEYLYMHSLAVCALMISLARQMKMSEEEVREAGLAGLLMDVGMPHVPDEIIFKDGPLTDEEMRIMRQHTTIAHDFLALGGDMPEQVLDVCLHHHERADGTGYPHGLKGKDIGLFARMAAICDVYDARTSNRLNRRGEDPSIVLEQMGEAVGTHFEADAFNAFVRALGIYPVGSLVRMRSGRLAVVVEQSPDDYTRPRIRAFYSIEDGKHIVPEDLDLCKYAGYDQIVCREVPESWDLPNWESRCSKLLRVAFRPK